MEKFIAQTIAVALYSAFVILFMMKTGIRERVQIKGSRIVSKLFSCDFCLSFWVALVLSIISAIFTKQIEFILIPFLSTPLTRILI